MTQKSRLIGKLTGTIMTLTSVLLISILFLLLFSTDKSNSLYYFFVGPFLNKLSMGNMLNSFSLLTFSGLAITVAFRADVFNLGGEGQIYAGAISATALLLFFPQLNGAGGIIAATATAALTGGFLAGFSGWLKSRWDVDELISTFLLSGGIIHVINYLITGPMADRDSYLLTTKTISQGNHLTRILLPSNLNTSLYGALATVLIVTFFLYYTKQGYELRICGMNREFAHYGGLNTKLYIILPMFVSGALMGLAGSSAVLGVYHSTIKDFYSGIGWNGIAVALIAGTNPLAVIPSAFVFAFLKQAASTAMIKADFPFELGGMIQAVVFLLISSRLLAEKADSLITFFKKRNST